MEKDNVYVLFEEIKNKIEMINGKLEQKTGTPVGGQAEEVNPTCIRHIHRHSFDIRSSKAFSLLVGMGLVCSLSLWGNIRLWQSNRQYADDALKFRAIRSWGMQPVLMGKYQTLAVQPAICRRCPEVPCHPFLERVYSGRYSLVEQGFRHPS